ncbi:hypothetical protein SL1157_1145 [Ruegeria lacuscaerulensis ITI-1157]|nr:hypothetical protein SL1157_1145 [Ruegeria lacuscaerulensis ITI-1157]
MALTLWYLPLTSLEAFDRTIFPPSYLWVARKVGKPVATKTRKDPLE